VRFFFDNNLSTKLAKSIHVLVDPEHQVVHLKDRFAAATPDET
jgi:PIN like domain